jgi:uncharacterized membrane protein
MNAENAVVNQTDTSVVAIFQTHLEAEEAVKTLEEEGFDMTKLSIVGRDLHTEQHVTGYYNTGDRMMAWGRLGAFWGGIWGILFGSAFFFVPGVGPLVVGGPLVSAIVGALEGAVFGGGLSALGAGLFSIGIPRDSLLRYETAVRNDQFLLVARGDPEETRMARSVLESCDPEHLDTHPAAES